MSEIWLTVGSHNVITVRLEPNTVHGRDMAGQQKLYIPLQLQLSPAGQQGEIQYTLLRLAGKLSNHSLGEFASFDVGPLAEVPSSPAYFRQQEALVELDPQRIKRLEEVRNGNDALFQITLSGLLWYARQQKFEVTRTTGSLDVNIPKSHWVEKVVSAWNLSYTKVVEIRFPRNAAGDNFRAAYAKIESAQRLFANGHWKQTLGELYAAFEGLAKSFDFQRPDQQFFAELLSSVHPAKREKLKLAFDRFCDLLHLGRHEPNEDAQSFAVSPRDARLALTLSYAIFEYIVPEN
jgi:hypothetical protein